MYVNYAVGDGTRAGFLKAGRLLRLPGGPTDEFVVSGFPEAPADAPEETEAYRLLPAVLRPPKILCLLRSYRAHAEELGNEPPPEPTCFAKLENALNAHGAPILIPPDLDGEVHHEGELALVLRKGGRRIPAEEGLAHVGAVTVANDVTARTLQRSDAGRGWPWIRGKSMDTFLPLGPGLVPVDRAGDLAALTLTVRVNGEIRQSGETSRLLWPIGAIVSHLSRFLTLAPGDVILTGTPEGVGPIVPGDRVEVEIPGVGLLANPVRGE